MNNCGPRRPAPRLRVRSARQAGARGAPRGTSEESKHDHDQLGEPAAACALGAALLLSTTSATADPTPECNDGPGGLATECGTNSDTGTANQATAVGGESEASDSGTTAVGAFAKALADYDTAIGDNVIASGTNSSSFGALSAAVGLQSTAIGSGSLGAGTGSVAVGAFSQASGGQSIAIGTGATNLFDNSIDIGTSSS